MLCLPAYEVKGSTVRVSVGMGQAQCLNTVRTHPLPQPIARSPTCDRSVEILFFNLRDARKSHLPVASLIAAVFLTESIMYSGHVACGHRLS